MKIDPGRCPICGAAHTACTTDSGPIVIAQLPARDALVQGAVDGPTTPAPVESAPFSTKEYRGQRHARPVLEKDTR